MVNPAKFPVRSPLRWAFSKVLAGILFVCFAAGCGPVSTPPPATLVPTIAPTATLSTDCAAGSYVKEIISSGEPREYRLYIPPSYAPGKPTALVFGFHGNNGHAEQFESYSGFSALSDREGFIVVYPQGSGEHPHWNVWQGSKDVQFVSDLINRIATICSIDSNRIYAAGHSLGGGMVNRLACDLSGRIAAIGPVSGAYVNPEPCSPSHPVAVVAVHGTGDMDVYYNGIPPNGNMPGSYNGIGTPIPQWASAWAQRNGCKAKASIFFRKDPVSGQLWGDCRSGSDVVLYTISGGEHGWATPSADFNIARVIWEFFIRHPLVPGTTG